MGNIYILNRAAVKRFVESHTTVRGKKEQSCIELSEHIGVSFTTLYNKTPICNEKTRMIPRYIAESITCSRPTKSFDYDISDFVLDVTKTIILMNATGTLLWKSNEKIALSVMLLYYEEQEWWSPQGIINKAQDAGVVKDKLHEDIIKTILDNNSEIFETEKEKYRVNIDALIQYIREKTSE